jgi:hypothetical protein
LDDGPCQRRPCIDPKGGNRRGLEKMKQNNELGG